ncbi:unnamed protein product [Mytilus edulis]|uniref:Uncharacterized protein n=1 Tax=Mytilus edulis TaxID=6550 RepID=A0A8S3Q2F5_MYTED|nr:unnamed protein product [Mytilus edulis]
MMHKRTCTRKDLEQLLGHLNFASRVILPGRAFVTYLYKLMSTVKKVIIMYILTRNTKQIYRCDSRISRSFVKIFELKWDTVKDTITIQKVDLFDIELLNITKLEILRQSSCIYDPLGLRSLVSERAKILMQTLQSDSFLRNRVTEIRKLTNTQEWRYCPTKDNPADLLTRGLSVSQFEKNTLWFNGPEWITDTSKWPSWKPNETTVLLTSTDIEDSSTADNEIDNQQGIHQIVQITRYSTLSKLLRITAYLLRFIRNCHSPILQTNKAKYVSREESQDATECWIQNCQNTSFKDKMLYLKSKDTIPTVLVRQLRLYLNNKDVICVEGEFITHLFVKNEISLFVT